MKIIELFETQLLEEYTETIACGECFTYGFREVIGNENVILVHALVTHPYNGNKYPHAWIEDGNLVKDWQTMEMGTSKYAKAGWPIEEFYDVWKPEDVEKYTAKEAMAEYKSHKHTGPWKDFLYENVIDMTKYFGTKKGMFYNPDAEPPVSRTGESYVRFETEPMPSGKSAAIIGVLADGTKEEISFTNIETANALAKAYNAGGYSTQRIERIPFKEEIIPFRPKDTRPDQMKYNDALEDQTGNRADIGIIPCPYCDDEWCNFDCDEAQAGGFENEDANELFESNYLDLKVLKKLQKQGFGMINLEGDLYPAEMYDHLALFKKKPLIPEVYEMFQDLDERLSDASEEHMASVAPGEHPEWHAYEMYAESETDEIETKAMKIIYKNGWGRLGTTSTILELECLFEHQKILEKYSRELADMLNLEFTINVLTTLR